MRDSPPSGRQSGVAHAQESLNLGNCPSTYGRAVRRGSFPDLVIFLPDLVIVLSDLSSLTLSVGTVACFV